MNITTVPLTEVDYAEVVYSQFPKGENIVLIKEDEKNLDVFDFYLGEDARGEDPADWAQVLLMDGGIGGYVVADGEIVFVNKNTGDVFHTSETHVFPADAIEGWMRIGKDGITKVAAIEAPAPALGAVS